MNIQLDSAEQHFVRELAKELAEEIREQVVKDLSESSVLWSKETTALRIGGELDHASVDYVDSLIADGEIEVFKSGRNGGGRVWIVPESVAGWKQRKRNERQQQR